MASDSQDSRRKHRRTSSDDESPEDSKRHKHRHRHRHRHHHHHHHRHSSKKHDQERKDEIQVESKGEVEEVRGIAPTAADYDMEEGEIVEDEGIRVPDTEIADRKLDSDVESGEIKPFEGRTEFDGLYTRSVTEMISPADNNWKSTGSDRSDGSKKHESLHHHDEPPLLESFVNGDSDSKSRKSVSTSHSKCNSFSKESSKLKFQHENESKDFSDMDEDEYGERQSTSSHKGRERGHKASSHSPSHDPYHVETSDKSRSASPDRMRKRERSRSILYDEPPRMRHHYERDVGLYDNGRVHDDLNDERDNHKITNYRFDKRDTTRDRRERSLSHHRSSMRQSKGEHGDYWDPEGEEKIYKDKRRVKEQEKTSDRSGKDSDHYRVLDKEQKRSTGRDNDWEKESDRDRGRFREIKSDDWDTERDRERRRDKNRDRSRDMELVREERRDNSIAKYRDRDAEKDRDRLRDRDRKLEMDRGRDRNGARDRRRDRTRDIDSDRRYHKYDDYDDGYGNRQHGRDEAEHRIYTDKKHDSGKNRGPKYDFLKGNGGGLNRDDDDQKDYQEKVDLELAEQEDDDADRVKEQSRRLREAILQKYKAKESQPEAMLQSAEVLSEELEEQPYKDVVMTVPDQENVKINSSGQGSTAVETSFDLGKSPSRNDSVAVQKSTGGLGEGTPKSEKSNDMFCDDIFGDSPAGVRKTGKGDGLPVERSGLHDNWDDPEGYYSFRFGEILDSRYEITAAHGKGVFSTVVRAKDLKAGAGDPEEVAIKIIRNNETMLKAGTEELVILKKLVGADQDDRRHCVRYLSHFKYRNHLCIVFESLHMNLREVLKKFGRNIGLKLTAVRAYAKQLFIALKHLRNCGVLHCDIKPDNMLVNDAKNVLKLCDFGNAMFAGKNEITPYLVSRFYRAPEIILGLPYDHPMDMWSVGCCLYELYTGKVLFPGSTNNDMLRLHMELKGPFPKKMLRKGAFVEQHFDPNLNFLAMEEDPVTKKPIRRPIVNVKPKDIGAIVKGSPGEDPKMLANFKDLLDKMFALDPEKRLTVSQALSHPFITGK